MRTREDYIDHQILEDKERRLGLGSFPEREEEPGEFDEIEPDWNPLEDEDEED